MQAEHNRLNINQINELAKNNPRDLVAYGEGKYQDELLNAIDIIGKNKHCSILLTSGPSASTKTTTSQKLADLLCEEGTNTVVVSLDNFFVNRCNLPKLENGDTDYESVKTLDMETLARCFDELLNNGKAEFPLFDFTTGSRTEETIPLETTENSLVIIEGIHALHPEITSGLPRDRYLKMYISPHSDYYLDDELVLSSRNTRLIRRLVRDYFYRGNSAEGTLKMWANVVKSEVENIIPFRPTADFAVDSTICYEPCVFGYFLQDVASEYKGDSEGEKKRLSDLKDVLNRFVSLPRPFIPNDSVLWEFLH